MPLGSVILCDVSNIIEALSQSVALIDLYSQNTILERFNRYPVYRLLLLLLLPLLLLLAATTAASTTATATTTLLLLMLFLLLLLLLPPPPYLPFSLPPSPPPFSLTALTVRYGPLLPV